MQEGKSNGMCDEFAKCMKILHLMLDHEATPEEETYVNDHIDKCMVCFEQYQVEKQIRELLKTRLVNQPVPKNLADDIRSKIQSVSI
jgi:anti-sigma factor (TIGR02949 family)